MKPCVSILSPDFKYVPAACTDIARTFARLRREQRERAEASAAPDDCANNPRCFLANFYRQRNNSAPTMSVQMKVRTFQTLFE
jgi:hypothetical protein